MEPHPLKYKSLEIVGLDQGSFGRLCGIHPTNCGAAVNVGTLLKLQPATIEVPLTKQIKIPTVQVDQPRKRGRPKSVPVEYVLEHTVESTETMKAFLWINGVETCCVGFVSKAFQAIYYNSLKGRVVEVTNDYRNNPNKSHTQRSKENNGLVTGIIIG